MANKKNPGNIQNRTARNNLMIKSVKEGKKKNLRNYQYRRCVLIIFLVGACQFISWTVVPLPAVANIRTDRGRLRRAEWGWEGGGGGGVGTKALIMSQPWIGLLQLEVTWYKIRHTGEQMNMTSISGKCKQTENHNFLVTCVKFGVWHILLLSSMAYIAPCLNFCPDWVAINDVPLTPLVNVIVGNSHSLDIFCYLPTAPPPPPLSPH